MLPRDAEVTAEQALGGGGAQAHDQLGTDARHLRREPGLAGLDLCAVGALVESPLAARRSAPLEVLDDVRDVDLVANDAGRLKRLVEDPSGGTYERLALAILDVARLLADDQQARTLATGPEDGLGRVAPQRAILAALGLLGERAQGANHA